MKSTDAPDIFDFSGQTAVVTGGTGFLGGEMACALVTRGANVAILDLNLPAAQLGDRLDQGPGRAVAIQASVLDKQSLAAAESQIVSEFGRIDMLLNVAGAHHPQATTSADLSLFDLPEEALRYIVEINLMGTLFPVQQFGRSMAQQGAGVILNISSVSSFRSLTRVVAYSAAKAAVNNFTKWLAVHMAQEYSPNIRVNAIAPGFILTTVNRALLTDPQTGELSDRGRTIIEQTPMGRFGNPQEIVSTTLWLLSPASSFVTGVVVPVDGGFTAFSGV